MKKIILQDEEYIVLQKLLLAVPPAKLRTVIPLCDGGDIYYYRRLLTKVLHKDYSFPDAD